MSPFSRSDWDKIKAEQGEFSGGKDAREEYFRKHLVRIKKRDGALAEFIQYARERFSGERLMSAATTGEIVGLMMLFVVRLHEIQDSRATDTALDRTPPENTIAERELHELFRRIVDDNRID